MSDIEKNTATTTTTPAAEAAPATEEPKVRPFFSSLFFLLGCMVSEGD